jgi:hypothetical protein
MATDFALTPTGDVDISGSFAGLLKVRPDTALLGEKDGARSIKSFLGAIPLTGAISNLILTSHATPSGTLSLQLTDGASTSDLNYDTLEAELVKNQNVVRASAGILGRAVANAGIIVKGCALGRSPEFMALLQRAIGPKFGVIASLYGHCADRHPKDGGWIEFMEYELHQEYVLSKDGEFDMLDRAKLKLLTRAKLIADMKANPRNRQFDGDPFPDKVWEAMIPKLTALNATNPKIPPPHRKQFTAKFPSSWNLAPYRVREVDEKNNLLDIEKFQVFNEPLVFWTVSGATIPANKSPISERRDFMKAQLATSPKYQANHPYPVYKRHGFANLNDFVDHFDWGSAAGDTWVGKVWRFVKKIPITDLDNGNLIANHYSETIRHEHEDLLETHPLFFAAVPASL